MASKKSIAHSLRLAVHIVHSRYCGQRMSDLSDLSDLSDAWHLVQRVPCAPEFPKHMAQKWGLLAGCAHCAMHRVGAKNVGLVGLVGQVGPSFAGGFGGQAAQGAVRAMFPGVSKTHGLPRRSAAKTGAAAHFDQWKYPPIFRKFSRSFCTLIPRGVLFVSAAIAAAIPAACPVIQQPGMTRSEA